MAQFYWITKAEARSMGLVSITVRLPYHAEFKSWLFDECMRLRSAGRKAEVVNHKSGIQLYADLKYKAIDPTNKDRMATSRIWANPEFINGYQLDRIRAVEARAERERLWEATGDE